MIKTTVSIFLALSYGFITGCAPKDMPLGRLVGLDYTRSGTMAGYEYEMHLKTQENGDIILTGMRECYGPLFEKKIDVEALNAFQQIIEEEKMFAYKKRYSPKVEVLDGYMWSFMAKFADGNTIHSGGSNAAPGGSGLKKIKDLTTDLLKDALPATENQEEAE